MMPPEWETEYAVEVGWVDPVKAGVHDGGDSTTIKNFEDRDHVDRFIRTLVRDRQVAWWQVHHRQVMRRGWWQNERHHITDAEREAELARLFDENSAALAEMSTTPAPRLRVPEPDSEGGVS